MVLFLSLELAVLPKLAEQQAPAILLLLALLCWDCECMLPTWLFSMGSEGWNSGPHITP